VIPFDERHPRLPACPAFDSEPARRAGAGMRRREEACVPR
jgi:hypothetical protein